jgi:hypothetical protein
MSAELKNWTLAIWSAFWFGALAGMLSPAHAQNTTCPTRLPGDTTNACASTAFVQAAASAANVLTKGAICNGATDDSAAFNAMNIAGGSYVIPPGLTCAIASTVTFGNSTNFLISQGAALKWTGSAAGTMFTSGTTTQLHDFSMIGNDPGSPSIISGTTGTVFALHSMQYSTFSNLQIQTNSVTATAWSIAADSDFGVATSLSNTAFNSWRNLSHTGPVGTVMNITGILLHANPQVVTLNNFNNIWAGYQPNTGGNINVCGICFNIDVDNNNFDGQTYLSIGAVNAIGVHFNSSASPTVFNGVYAIQFNNLAVDCLAGPFSGRVGIQLDKSNLIRANTFYNNPACEGGQIVTTNAGSYWIDQNVSSNNISEVLNSGWFIVSPNFTAGYNIAGGSSGSVLVTASNTGGHITLSSSANPTLTAGCNGAGSSVSGTDTTGTVTGQTAAATTCTLTFATAFAATPFCLAMGISSPLTGAATAGTGTLVVNFASTSNYKFSYFCQGN